MMYLMIRNPGVAPVEAFTLLGASNKSGTDAIGQFGSGTKFGTLALLRANLPPVIYSGLTRIEFGTTEFDFDGATQERVHVKLSGKTAERDLTDEQWDNIEAQVNSRLIDHELS